MVRPIIGLTMLGLEVGQVNEGAEVGCVPKTQLAINLDNTQNALFWAKKRRKVVITPGYVNYPTGFEQVEEQASVDWSENPINLGA